MVELTKKEDSKFNNNQFAQKIANLSIEYELSIFNLTNIYASLLKLYNLALRSSLFKQEVYKNSYNNCKVNISYNSFKIFPY